MNATTPAGNREHPVPVLLVRPERCDRCSAAALVRVELPAGGELHFCGHHARKHSTRLLEIGAALRSAL
jgi:hypothetical protein